MIDGAVARKTGTVSEFGSRLDTIADIVFVAVCLIKVIPVLDVPVWLYIWITIIAFIKVANIAVGYIRAGSWNCCRGLYTVNFLFVRKSLNRDIAGRLLKRMGCHLVRGNSKICNMNNKKEQSHEKQTRYLRLSERKRYLA